LWSGDLLEGIQITLEETSQEDDTEEEDESEEDDEYKMKKSCYSP